MKIKKKTGLLLGATAAVAAAGIAAVSFAAWTGSNDTYTAYAATGTATLFGFTEDQSSANVNLGTLVPYDQDEGSYTAGSTIVSKALPEYSVYSDYSISVSMENATETMSFYVLIGAQQTAVPNGAPDTWTGWKAVGESSSFDFTAATGTVSDTYISLILVSDNTGDMEQTVNFTVELTQNA